MRRKPYETLESLLENTAWIPFCGCQIWLGSVNPNGYGTILHKGRKYYTHRRAKMFSIGRELSKGELVLHKCDTHSCCNPAHLYVGTHLDNTRDMIERNRCNYSKAMRGEAHSSAKCSDADVRTIRELRAAGSSFRELAKRYGIAIRAAYCICTRKTWKHIA